MQFYQIIYNEVPCTSCWPPAEFRFLVDNFQCMFVNLIRLAGFYWAQQQGNLQNSHQLQARGKMDGHPEYNERREKLQYKKEQKGSNKAGAIAVGGAVGLGVGVILVGGGLAIVSNPNIVDYNDTNLLDTIADGFHDGLSVLGDISFGDMIDVGEGALGVFEDIDWPDIDFDGFADAAGDLFGDAGEFFVDAGEGVADVAGDVIGGIGDLFD